MMIRGEKTKDTYDDEYTIEILQNGMIPMLSKTLIDLNLFIGFLKSKKPECIDDFTQALVKRLKSLTLDSESVANFEYDSQHLSEYPEIEEIIKQVTLGMLNYAKYENDLKGESCKIPFQNYLKSYIPTINRTITALVDVIERDDALTLYKEYVDYRTDYLKDSRIPKVESLEELIKDPSEGGTGPHSAVGAILEGGRVVYRVNRCMWHEIQKEYGDMEIAYITACHFDFYAAILSNENFELTRTKTCMQGDVYCDFCWHDKRIDKTMEHPSEEFFESL